MLTQQIYLYLATAHHRNEHEHFKQVKCHEDERAASAARLELANLD
jgi:hypothetical protein